MENSKENKIIVNQKNLITKNKNYFGPMTFKLLSKKKNFNLMKYIQENKSKIKSHNTSRNKENTKNLEIKNIKDLLLLNIKNNKKKNSHSSNNSKLKGERNLKKTLIMPYQTFNITSINQWKTKYNTKNNSSKMQYTNQNITKNMSIPSPHIRQYSTEYNIINSRQKSSIIIDKIVDRKNIDLVCNLKSYIKKNEKEINIKNREDNKINNKVKEEDIYFKLENIKFRCHQLLKNFSNNANYLKNEINKYKNNNCNISLKYNRFYNTNNTEI